MKLYGFKHFFKENTWLGVRNFVDTGNETGALKEMSLFFEQAVIEDFISTRYKHVLNRCKY